MEILQVNKRHWDHLGGVETVVRMAFEVFRESGHSTTILAISKTTHNQHRQIEGLNIFESGQVAIQFGMPLSWSFLVGTKNLFSSVDFIFLHHPFPLGFLVYWLYGWNKPLLVWYHSDIVRQKHLAWLLRPLFARVLGKAKHIIVSDQSIANSSILLKPFLEKVVVVPFCVPLPEARVSIKPKSDIRLLSVGRLVYYKGYDYLIKAMQGVNAELTIIGEGHLKEKLSALVGELKLNNVKILPPVEDLSSYYENCDIFILPSTEKSEAFGLVQLEAMAYAKPVINTNLPTAVPNVSLDGLTGITVEPKDIAGLRGAIVKLVENPELRAQYGQAARDRVAKHYSPEIFSRTLMDIIRRTVNE